MSDKPLGGHYVGLQYLGATIQSTGHYTYVVKIVKSAIDIYKFFGQVIIDSIFTTVFGHVFDQK